MKFTDTEGNFYYTLGDRLYVDLVKRQTTKYIGKLTENINTGKVTLIVSRTKDQKSTLGYTLSHEPLKRFNLARLILIEDNTRIFYIDWENPPFDKANIVTINNIKSNYEPQAVFADNWWTSIDNMDLGSVSS